MANERASEQSFCKPLTAVLNANKVTGAERAVLGNLLEGQSNLEIAASLFLSEKSIKFHLTSLYKKLNVRDRTQLVIKCAKLGHYSSKPQSSGSLPIGAAQ